MEQPANLSRLEIAFLSAIILSTYLAVFAVFVWVYVMIWLHPWGIAFYGVCALILVLTPVLSHIKGKFYYTRREIVCSTMVSMAMACLFFLNHAGIFPFGSGFFVIGSLCNLAVILANGFYMPVAQRAEHLIKNQKNRYLYKVHNSETKLKFLSDTITLGGAGVTVSIGDIFIVTGKYSMFVETLRWLAS